VSNVTGIVNPVREITARAHAAGATVLVDGAQAAGHFPVDVRELGCDFYAFSGHKMFAETGIGVLYGRQSLLERMAPCQFGGGMIATVELERASFAPPPLKFEAGTPNVAAAVSLGAAVAFVTELGLDAIHRHGLAIMEYATEALRKAQGTVLYGAETPRRSGSLSFNLRGVDAYDVGLVLDTMGIAVRTGTHCAAPLVHRLGVDGTVRASFALYTTPQEIDLLADGVARAAKMLLPAHC
jgi:cysteine desulfurase/selenocysteine lyase